MNPKIRIHKGFFIALLMLVLNARAMEEILADTQALVSAQADNPDEFTIQVPKIINAKTSDFGELFDLNKTESILWDSFQNLVRAQHAKNKPYILARTLEQGENGCVVQCFDAHALNKTLFGPYPMTTLKDLGMYKNPVSNIPMQFLEYYECKPNKKIFEFMCSYAALRSELKKKYQLSLWRLHANQEDDLALVAQAKSNIADAYYYGRGVPEDCQNAFQILQEVANQKDDLAEAVRARFNVALMYSDGLGVPKDHEKAFKIWQEVANQKDYLALAVSSRLNIAVMYYNGHGVPQDYQEALKIWQEVANQKENLAEAAKAKHNVACAYCTGNGVQQNPEEARRLMQEVAQQTDSIEMATKAQKWLKENKV